MSISLIEGEEILEQSHPHSLSMFFLPMVWLYVGCMGLLFIIFDDRLRSWIYTLPLGIPGEQAIFFVVWCALLLLPATLISFLRINWYWLFVAVLICTAGILTFWWRNDVYALVASLEKYPLAVQIASRITEHWPFAIGGKELLTTDKIAECLLLIVSFLGLLSCRGYRLAHRYYITNRRIVTRFGFFIIRERDLLYSKIDDLMIHQSLLGRIFNFGTLIPISASGIGTGSDHVMLAAGIGEKLPFGPSIKVTIGGGQSITIPRAPSFYSLYGVPDPGQLKNTILKQMDQREYGYTRRQDEQRQKKER